MLIWFLCTVIVILCVVIIFLIKEILSIREIANRFVRICFENKIDFISREKNYLKIFRFFGIIFPEMENRNKRLEKETITKYGDWIDENEKLDLEWLKKKKIKN